ncbi:MAG: ABC transporter ATP-binding protein [Spirochaetota bacterium]
MALLQMDEITKTFPGVVANDGISFDLNAGEIHALVGENGAGKTTLMKILYGLYKPDEGIIRVRDNEVAIANPKDAIRKGIGMVHQHFTLVPVFTVSENILLGDEIPEKIETPQQGRGSFLERVRDIFFLDHRRAEERIKRVMEQSKITVDLGEITEELPVGIQQRVEILKVLYRGAEILVFDEPTAVLTPQEIRELFATFRDLAQQGRGIVFITHKLDEVLAIADRITVIRRGKIIETMPREGATKQQIAELMVGKPVLLSVDNPPAEPGEVVLSVRNVTYSTPDGRKALDEIDFELRRGEILGIAGVEGNGQTQLIRALSESSPHVTGEIHFKGQEISHMDVRQRRDVGISHIPEDRHRYGMIMPFTLAENMTLGRHHRPPFVNKLQIIQRRNIREFAAKTIREYDIRTPSETLPAHALSGGNQQKAVVARELSTEPDVLLASQPTRGVDVGAQEFIYKQLVAAKRAGRAVLLISADLDEVLSLSDRIAVIYKGKLIKEFAREEATREKVGYYMTGEHEGE